MHMTRIIAGLHSTLGKSGCLWDGEGARLPFLFFFLMKPEGTLCLCLSDYEL